MLYIVASPIGNLDDLSIRQAKTLLSSDIVLTEDTRSARILLDACKKIIKQETADIKILSYFKQSEFEKLPQVIDWLKQGKNISLISQAGTPLISDPGYLLVKTAIQQNLPLTVIPGPSAIITSLVYSGFNPQGKNGGFMFGGFMPKKDNDIIRMINRLKDIKDILPEMIFVFYESPVRIINTLNLIKQSDWNPDIVICREMTKKFEEIIRGKTDQLLKLNYKGEITLLIK